MFDLCIGNVNGPRREGQEMYRMQRKRWVCNPSGLAISIPMAQSKGYYDAQNQIPKQRPYLSKVTGSSSIYNLTY